MVKKIKKTKDGKSYMNIGCGNTMSLEWNNLDLKGSDGVIAYDARDPLPYEDNSFECVYSSHFFEHLTLKESENILRDIFRVLKIGGIVRIVVPDLQKICEEYLKYLKLTETDPTPQNIQRYEWTKIMLLDQMTRTKGGGLMREALDNKEIDEEYLKESIGDMAVSTPKEKPAKENILKSILKKILGKYVSRIRKNLRDPRKSGEMHKWMYDKLSLKLLLEANGFKGAKSMNFNESGIEYWSKYHLDTSKFDSGKPRKPESIFVEAQKL